MSVYQAAPCASASSRRVWPLSSATPPLAALPTVPALARVFVRDPACLWHEDFLVPDAELIVSELTGNAVAASADTDGRPVYVDGRMPVIRVCLLTDGVRLLVEVCRAPGIPVVREVTGDEESGRGLVLVNVISDKWGWDPAEGQPGKVVWAEISLLGDRGGAAASAVRNESADGILVRVRDALRCL